MHTHTALHRFALEQRIMELEAGRLEHHVRVEDHAALADERDSFARRLREADDEANRLRKMLDAEREQVCYFSSTGAFLHMTAVPAALLRGYYGTHLVVTAQMQSAESLKEVRRLNTLLAALEAASAGGV